MALPPPKRQRVSPGPSPLGGTPTYESHSYSFPPAQPYGAPNGYNPQQSFNQPQSQPQLYQNLPPIDTASRATPGNMGPPEKPRADKATDINDLSDLVTAAGVDLRAEENYMAATYRNKHQETSFNSSFGTVTSSTVSPENSFQQWSQNSYGGHPAYQPNANFTRPPVSQLSIEEELKKRQTELAREKAKIKAVHLRDPFLAANAVRNKLHHVAYNNQVVFNTLQGVKQFEQSQPNLTPKDVRGTSMVGPGGTGLVAAKIITQLDPGSQLVDVLSLLSLACNERLRTLLEESYAIARSRQHGTHGVVPPEWAGMAQGAGVPNDTQARSQAITNTAWDLMPESAISPLTVFPPKHNHSDPHTRLPTPPAESSPPLLPTIAYSSQITPALQSLAKADRDAEKKRLERRKRRDKDKESGGADTDDVSTPMGANSPSTPLTDAVPRVSKKEQMKQKNAHQTEDYMAAQANKAAAMALGKNKYAWMTAAAPAAAPASLSAGANLGKGVTAASRANSGSVGPPVPQVDAGMRSKEHWKKLGEWREDGVRGSGIQIRDFVAVLERQGTEKKTLARSYARMSSKDDMR